VKTEGAKRLALWLAREHVAQVALADVMGKSRAYVSMLLGGKIRPSLLAALELARVTRGRVSVAHWARPAKSPRRSTTRAAAVLLGLFLLGGTAAAECEDETGVRWEHPNAFSSGLRPQGLCLPPGMREQQRMLHGRAIDDPPAAPVYERNTRGGRACVGQIVTTDGSRIW